MTVTTEMRYKAARLTKSFVYKMDVKDAWHFLPQALVMKGDCEDYSLTLALILSGSLWKFWSNIFTRRMKIHFVRVMGSGSGHALLEYNGHYIDNNFGAWTTKGQM